MTHIQIYNIPVTKWTTSYNIDDHCLDIIISRKPIKENVAPGMVVFISKSQH